MSPSKNNGFVSIMVGVSWITKNRSPCFVLFFLSKRKSQALPEPSAASTSEIHKRNTRTKRSYAFQYYFVCLSCVREVNVRRASSLMWSSNQQHSDCIKSERLLMTAALAVFRVNQSAYTCRQWKWFWLKPHQSLPLRWDLLECFGGDVLLWGTRFAKSYQRSCEI